MKKNEEEKLTLHINKLIHFLREHTNGLNGREIAIAITNIETAELWARKAFKKGPKEGTQ